LGYLFIELLLRKDGRIDCVQQPMDPNQKSMVKVYKEEM